MSLFQMQRARNSVGGGKVRSILHPPNATPIIELAPWKPHPLDHNKVGGRKIFDLIDTNNHFDKENPPRNMDHWPLLAVLREYWANGIDAALESNEHTWRGRRPTITVTNTTTPLGGRLSINGFLGASWAVEIVKVKLNPKYVPHDDGADVHPQYIEILQKEDEAREEDDDNEDENVPPSNYEEVTYRVSILFESFSVLPVQDAYVNSCSSKNKNNGGSVKIR